MSPVAGRREGPCAVAGVVSEGSQLTDGRVDLLLHGAERQDVEDALTLAYEVDQLAVVESEHRARSGDHEIGGGEVGTEAPPQLGEHLAHDLEPDARVEQL